MGDSVGAHPSIWGFIAGLVIGIAIGIAFAVVILTAPISGPLLAVAGGLVMAGGIVSLGAIGAKIGKHWGEACKGHGSPCGPIATVGSSDTKIEDLPVARATLDLAGPCVIKKMPPLPISQGSSTVSVNGKPLVRDGDKAKCGGIVIMHCLDVWVGGEPAGESPSGYPDWVPSDEYLDEVAAVGGKMALAGSVLMVGAPLTYVFYKAGETVTEYGAAKAGEWGAARDQREGRKDHQWENLYGETGGYVAGIAGGIALAKVAGTAMEGAAATKGRFIEAPIPQRAMTATLEPPIQEEVLTSFGEKPELGAEANRLHDEGYTIRPDENATTAHTNPTTREIVTPPRTTAEEIVAPPRQEEVVAPPREEPAAPTKLSQSGSELPEGFARTEDGQVVEASDHPKVFRGDTRDPDVIFEEGFEPGGDRRNLFEHWAGRDESAFVPTSESVEVAGDYAEAQVEAGMGKDPWVYEIGNGRGFRIEDYGPDARRALELDPEMDSEVALERVRGSDIRSARNLETGEVVENPNFVRRAPPEEGSCATCNAAAAVPKTSNIAEIFEQRQAAPEVVDDSAHLFRGDSRTPAQLKAANGFKGHDPDQAISLEEHLAVKRRPSKWVSATKAEAAGDYYARDPYPVGETPRSPFEIFKRGGYNYRIGKSGGVDVDLASGKPIGNEEVAFSEPVEWKDIHSYRRVQPDIIEGPDGALLPNPDAGKGEWIANPDYTGPELPPLEPRGP